MLDIKPNVWYNRVKIREQAGVSEMIISSQRHVNYNTVDEKIAELGFATELVLETWLVGEIDGIEYEVLYDGHHRLVAARELGIPVRFIRREHPEGLTGLDLLEQFIIDSEWYDVETDIPVW